MVAVVAGGAGWDVGAPPSAGWDVAAPGVAVSPPSPSSDPDDEPPEELDDELPEDELLEELLDPSEDELLDPPEELLDPLDWATGVTGAPTTRPDVTPMTIATAMTTPQRALPAMCGRLDRGVARRSARRRRPAGRRRSALAPSVLGA